MFKLFRIPDRPGPKFPKVDLISFKELDSFYYALGIHQSCFWKRRIGEVKTLKTGKFD